MLLHDITGLFLTSSKHDSVLYCASEKYSHFLEISNALCLSLALHHIFSIGLSLQEHRQKNKLQWIVLPVIELIPGLQPRGFSQLWVWSFLFSQWVCTGFDCLHLLKSLHLEDEWTTSRGGKERPRSLCIKVFIIIFFTNYPIAIWIFNLSGCWEPCPSDWNSC